MLPLVLVAFGAGPGVAVIAILGAALYTTFMLKFGRRLLVPLERAVQARGEMTTDILAITMLLFCLSAFLMDAIGIHAIFGGFLIGVCMPRDLLVEELKKKVDPLAVVLLLPMFFTYSELDTQPRCLIPRFDGAILSLEWKEAAWDRYVMGAPRPRTPSEQQYSDRKLRSRR